MKKNSAFLYTTALGAMLALSQPVFSQTSGSTSGSGPNSRTGTTTGTSGTNSGTTTGTTGTTGTTTGSSTDIMSKNPAIDSMWGTESAYWRSHYSSRPYYNKSTKYSTFEPAYRFGLYSYNQNAGQSFDELDKAQLQSEWERMRGNSTLTWEQAEPAVRDSYTRMYDNKNKSGSTTGGSPK